MVNEERLEEPGLLKILEKNMDALKKRNQEAERRKSNQHKLVDSITRFAGSMKSVYLHIFIFGGWVS